MSRARREALASLYADKVVGPGLHIANAWLITSADTMPRELKSKLHWLSCFWRYTADGIMKHTREAWLAIPELLRWEVMLKHEYHPSKIERLCYARNPLMALLDVA